MSAQSLPHCEASASVCPLETQQAHVQEPHLSNLPAQVFSSFSSAQTNSTGDNNSMVTNAHAAATVMSTPMECSPSIPTTATSSAHQTTSHQPQPHQQEAQPQPQPQPEEPAGEIDSAGGGSAGGANAERVYKGQVLTIDYLEENGLFDLPIYVSAFQAGLRGTPSADGHLSVPRGSRWGNA